MGRSLFIADLHLAEQRPATTRAFLRFLDEPAQHADLYILGDLFDYWIGDDHSTALSCTVVDAFKRHTHNGHNIYLLPGNRDFLVGERFSEATGVLLLSDSVVDIQGMATLLMHGDALCTDDTDYQAFRAESRTPQWQQAFLALSIEERDRRARELRALSAETTGLKPEAITDVNADAVNQIMRQTGSSRLIHGHTHRPGIHRWIDEGVTRERYVLDEWSTAGSYIEASSKSLEVLEFNF